MTDEEIRARFLEIGFGCQRLRHIKASWSPANKSITEEFEQFGEGKRCFLYWKQNKKTGNVVFFQALPQSFFDRFNHE